MQEILIRQKKAFYKKLEFRIRVHETLVIRHPSVLYSVCLLLAVAFT